MESQFIRLGTGLRLHLIIAGDDIHPPLVLLHGYPGSNYLWRNLIPRFAEVFRVYAPDLPGHGESDKPLDISYDLNFLVGFLADLFDTLCLDQANLVAHDLGAMAALGFVSRHHERIARLVIMNTAPYADWPKLLSVFIKRARRPAFARLFLSPWVFKWILKSYLVHQPHVVTSEIAAFYRAPWVDTMAGRKSFSHVIAPQPETLVESPENLRKIETPTLILWGKKDRILPVRYGYRLHRDLPNSQLITVPNCGHFLQEEEPELVTTHILSFLKAEGLKVVG